MIKTDGNNNFKLKFEEKIVSPETLFPGASPYLCTESTYARVAALRFIFKHAWLIQLLVTVVFILGTICLGYTPSTVAKAFQLVFAYGAATTLNAMSWMTFGVHIIWYLHREEFRLNHQANIKKRHNELLEYQARKLAYLTQMEVAINDFVVDTRANLLLVPSSSESSKYGGYYEIT